MKESKINSDIINYSFKLRWERTILEPNFALNYTEINLESLCESKWSDTQFHWYNWVYNLYLLILFAR